MKKPIVNPLHISVMPLAGRQLPSDFNRVPMPAHGNYDQRNWDEVFAAPKWASKFNSENVGNIVRYSRLSTAASGI